MITLDNLLNRELLLVSGKGGTGKTLLVAALGCKAAAMGKRVLLVESSVTEQLAPLFAAKPVGHFEREVAKHLSLINLNPKLCFKEYVVDHLGMTQLYKRVFDHRVVKTFLDSIPGLGETMLLGRLFYTCELRSPRPYDLVIFDAPASGHFYKLLTTPDAIVDSGLLGPLVKEVERVRAFLADPKRCGAIIASIPEELIISETLEFLPRLIGDTPLAILGVIINRFYPAEEPGPAELAALAKACPPLQAAASYLERGLTRQLELQQTLAAGLQTLGLEGRYSWVGEQGPIAEPLTLAMADELLKALA